MRFRRGDAVYTRSVFASFPAQVIVIRLDCDRPGRVAFTARLDSPLHHTTKADGTDRIAMQGRCPKQVDPSYIHSQTPILYDDSPDGEGMRFATYLQAVARGGTVASDDRGLHVSGADGVTLILSAATSFNGFDKSPGRQGKDPHAPALDHLRAGVGTSYEKLLAEHVRDHQALFRRVSLDLGATDGPPTPTDERLARYQEGHDPRLEALLFQYGRYLMIASSRPGGQPANLQGIWNDQMRPPWSSNWTLNINAEMNYWPVETCNLAECHLPLIDFIADLAVNGRKTAEINYGAHGWTAHHNADLWRQSAPVGDGSGNPVWANWAMGGPWLCQHLWEHYAFGADERYLRERAWPTMKGSAEFCLDWLIEDGKGHLVTAPSTSPELAFIGPDGRQARVSMATTMDMAIIRDLFTNAIAGDFSLNTTACFA